MNLGSERKEEEGKEKDEGKNRNPPLYPQSSQEDVNGATSWERYTQSKKLFSNGQTPETQAKPI